MRLKLNSNEFNIFFTSDTHFCHANVMKYNPKTRPYDCVDEMNETLINIWNSMISPNDIVFHTGDFMFCKFSKALEILNRLNGIIYFIKGNHDQVIMKNKKLRDRFETISDYGKVTIDDQLLILFHYPIIEWEKCHYGSFHVHGHVHGALPSSRFRMMDIGIDAHPKGRIFTWQEIKDTLTPREILKHGSEVVCNG